MPCQCNECAIAREKFDEGHESDCAVHGQPAQEKGECNCKVASIKLVEESDHLIEYKGEVEIEDGLSPEEEIEALADKIQEMEVEDDN